MGKDGNIKNCWTSLRICVFPIDLLVLPFCYRCKTRLCYYYFCLLNPTWRNDPIVTKRRFMIFGYFWDQHAVASRSEVLGISFSLHFIEDDWQIS